MFRFLLLELWALSAALDNTELALNGFYPDLTVIMEGRRRIGSMELRSTGARCVAVADVDQLKIKCNLISEKAS